MGIAEPGGDTGLQAQFDAAVRELDEGAKISDVIGKYADLNRHLRQLPRRDSVAYGQLLTEIGLPPVNPGAGDRLADFIIHLAGARRMLFLLAAVLLAFVPALLAHFENGLVNPSLTPDLLHDVGYWNSFVVAAAALVIMVSGYLGRLPRVLFELSVSSTLLVTKNEWSSFRDDANSVYSKRLLVAIPWLLALSMVMIALLFYTLGSSGSWHHHDGYQATPSAIAHLVPVFLLYYLIALLLVRVASTFVVLKRLFVLRINVQPLHPDRCGGLAPLGSLSVGLNVGTFLFGVIVALGIYSNVEAHADMSLGHPLNVMMGVGYLLGASMLFFLPLFSAHRRMREARYETLRSINARFEPVNQQVLAELNETSEVDSGKVEQLNLLRTLHEIAAGMPIYPFDVATVLSFLGTILAPLALLFLQEFVSKHW